ncbi:Ras guanine nucleotide exchange factor A [Beauveria bassiana]|nr:Ras guanine nucleotide exchange factor A [Beauveria bassiana]KAH8713362.1 Ras guanine nucleotide exchange factor A [Beauveria bassiana]
MESYTIAVIGSAGAGKSTFIQKVLGLSRPPIGSSASVRLVVDNVTHGVSLFELDLENFDQTASSQTIQWPKQINGHIVPRPDAALVLYDVTNPDSVRPLPQAMTAITNAGLPSILVACKCETDEDDWELDADGIANHKIFKSCIGTYKVSSGKADVSRSCLQAILKAAITYRKGMPAPSCQCQYDSNSTAEHSETITRRRAQSAVNLEAPDTSAGRPLSQQSKHSRASSEMSALKGFGTQSSESYRARASKNSGQAYRNEKAGADYFLDVEESDSDGQTYSDDTPILQRGEDNFVEKQPKMSGVPLAELVDRLLALRLSRADNNFSDIFLCLYRKFTTPTELFSAILSRLDRVRDDKTAHYLSKTATQLRIIEVIAKWVSLYPGDFAKFSTRRSLFEFIQHLSAEPIFSVASQQMRRSLWKSTLEDDDTGWATSDHSGSDSDDEESSKEMDELSASIGMAQIDQDGERGSEAPVPADFAGQPGGQVQFHSYDEYEREAASLEPADLHPMNKTRYHIFMDLSDDEIADELTRIDWILFSSIRIRDFVRYVNLSSTKKGKAASLRNVNRMINHFNHIAKWVANLILLRDKAKHRAQMLEKFMNVAIKLRQLNNYNGLAAVLAGINGIAIHRLAQTRQLVSPEVQKRFARAVILMSTQKSHSAYRLAWENSPLPRIPFVPLHLRDLVNAEEGSKTFVGPNGDRVNWRKFEVLGDVLLPLMKSQGTSYPNLAKHMLTRELILGCRMPTDDEEIYQRSIEVESGNPTGVFDPAKKKFPWFAK